MTSARSVGRRLVIRLLLSVGRAVRNYKINEFRTYFCEILILTIDMFECWYGTYVSPKRSRGLDMTVMSRTGASIQCPRAFSAQLVANGLFLKARLVLLGVASPTLGYRFSQSHLHTF